MTINWWTKRTNAKAFLQTYATQTAKTTGKPKQRNTKQTSIIKTVYKYGIILAHFSYFCQLFIDNFLKS